MAFRIDSSGGDEENEEMADINIIPLVDVMLVLLIIFMVTAPLSIGGINVNLPTSKAKGKKIAEERVVLSINKSGDFFIEKSQIPRSALIEKFKAIFEFRENKELYIRADRGVDYGKVVDAMSAARISGVSKLNMLTQRPGSKSK